MAGIWVSTPISALYQIYWPSLLLRALAYIELSSTWSVCNLSPYLKELAETDTGASYKHHPQHSPRERNTFLAFGIKTNYSLYGITTPITNILFSCSVVSDSLSTPWTVAHQAPLSIGFPRQENWSGCQAPLSIGFPRQENWSGLPFPSPRALHHTGIEPISPALQVDSLPLSHLGNQQETR